MALTKDPLFWQIGIVFGVILLGGLGYSVISNRPIIVSSKYFLFSQE